MQSDLLPVHDDAAFERFIASFTSYERMRDFTYDDRALRLDRMRAFAHDLGDPQNAYPSVHVAGTKGKGSTCLILEALAARRLGRVGTYMSPHLEHVRERIRLDGEAIGEPALCETLNGMLPVLRALRERGPDWFPTFFELMTGIAMAHFASRGVDLAIFEVGLGGRLDATNVLSPGWTAITNIGLEHTRTLGKTLDAIAREKAGILKPGVPLVLGPVAPEARAAIIDGATRLECPVREVPEDAVRLTPDGELAVDGFRSHFPPGAIRGPGLRCDLGVALALYETVAARSGLEPDEDDLRGALASVRLPGRVELFPTRPPVVVDGAHTRESVRALEIALDEMRLPRPRNLVLSVAADKQLESILLAADAIADDVYFTMADPQRSIPPLELAAAYERSAGRRVPEERVIDDPRRALETACAAGRPVVVTGSLYLAGAVRPAVGAMTRWGTCAVEVTD